MGMDGKRVGLILVCLLSTLVLVVGAVFTCGTTGRSSSGITVKATANRYTITHVTAEPDWSTVPVLDMDNQPWTDPVDISAHAQICYGDDALYVHLWAREANIRAEYTSTDVQGNPFEDSCMEFFFAPVANDARYFNIEMNPNCCIYLGVGTGRYDRVRMLDGIETLQPVATRTADGWDLTYKVPFEFIRTIFPNFQAKTGGVMLGNLYKCGNLTVQKHYLSWNPMSSEKPDFHRPQDFGVLVFG